MKADVKHAAELLREGELVAFPTETVYGLGADAQSEAAVKKIFEAKGRPADHPLIVHLGAASWLDDWVTSAPELATALAQRFWPGPLTLVLERGARVPRVVTGGLDSVAVRVPAHPLALELLQAFGSAIAAPSANRFGNVSPTTAEHVRAELGDDVFILDGGPSNVGVESTIVDLSRGAPVILRPGGVTREALEAVVGAAVPVSATVEVRAPGTLETHYAPRARVVLVDDADLTAEANRRTRAGERVGVLCRAPLAGLTPGIAALCLPESDEEAARALYAALRELDAGVDVILAALPEETGLGLAIADRLRRAAGPRSME
jgi:L-threonylcarbamoyladenylate synthase